MIDKLISEGHALESKAEEGTIGKFFSSVDFEKWASKSILYLETNYGYSTVTEKAKEKFKSINTNNNYSFYQFLLGSLIATKEFEEQ
ncbi:hypothetical protein [Priestia flexa]|uniref:hypothetical protein n=1 Tax=Priestia flexa TaxID=86664 RepID=UPI001CFC49B5|nr:hypothetical protein [Priestia flexa]